MDGSFSGHAVFHPCYGYFWCKGLLVLKDLLSTFISKKRSFVLGADDLRRAV